LAISAKKLRGSRRDDRAESPAGFPPPWSIEDIGAAFFVKDSGGQKLVYVHSQEERQVRLFDAEFIEC
jgi:hypothetical protein